ncbi:MAG: ribosome recycling factor [Candidatus Lambdaproteobacteria bacterium]|nr:ribosome recycling factor [Candidatus Lambdaproteobacteria bacterium]
MQQEIEQETRKKMNHSVELIKAEIAAVRTGRASTDFIAPVIVDIYGSKMPLSQLATLATPDPQLITVTPYDRSAVKTIEKAIASADLGLNPSSEGSVIRVPVPVLTAERRKELIKHVHKLGEEGKVAIRNLRRDANDKLKKLNKDKQISQDDEKSALERVQKETDAHTKAIEELVKSKEQDLMKV